jgi:hypothetical protein
MIDSIIHLCIYLLVIQVNHVASCLSNAPIQYINPSRQLIIELTICANITHMIVMKLASSQNEPILIEYLTRFLLVELLLYISTSRISNLKPKASA